MDIEHLWSKFHDLEDLHPCLEILEQPKQRGMRFRYECEGRSAGSIPGERSTDTNRTYPAVKIQNYKGPAKIRVSLVTKSNPPRPHPHSLVGRECKDGICEMELLPGNSTTAYFPNLGIQCVRRREILDSLRLRLQRNVDPFQVGNAALNLEDIDLNVVRLCFEAFITDATGNMAALPPIVTQEIRDRRATSTSELKICRVSRSVGSVQGGDEVFLLCDKVQRDDIEVRFSIDNWEAKGSFSQTDVHRQVAIVFCTPPFHDQNIYNEMTVRMQLRRPSDGEVSESVDFRYLPRDRDPFGIGIKRQRKMIDFTKRLEDMPGPLCRKLPVRRPMDNPAIPSHSPMNPAKPTVTFDIHPMPPRMTFQSNPTPDIHSVHTQHTAMPQYNVPGMGTGVGGDCSTMPGPPASHMNSVYTGIQPTPVPSSEPQVPRAFTGTGSSAQNDSCMSFNIEGTFTELLKLEPAPSFQTEPCSRHGGNVPMPYTAKSRTTSRLPSDLEGVMVTALGTPNCTAPSACSAYPLFTGCQTTYISSPLQQSSAVQAATIPASAAPMYLPYSGTSAYSVPQVCAPVFGYTGDVTVIEPRAGQHVMPNAAIGERVHSTTISQELREIIMREPQDGDPPVDFTSQEFERLIKGTEGSMGNVPTSSQAPFSNQGPGNGVS
uniref:V-rel avian reticuloendotheliosis viral oncogene homolog n=2 Tax=Eptatretus burgeri TaxID=7764 RepID=A0A8C4NGI6_EPTBU